MTPFAKDLTVHAGKGESSLAARLSAIMEAIERVSAESVAASRIVRASYRELHEGADSLVVDPAQFDLPFGSVYRPDLPIDWILGYDFAQQRPCYVAKDFVITPAVESVAIGVETNGLASGNTLLEAIVHALYELIERDAVSEAHFSELFCETSDSGFELVKIVDHASLPSRSREWVDRLEKKSLAIRVQELTNDCGVPVYSVTLIDSSFPGMEGEPISFGGYGADLRPERAVFRAITEAVQSHTIVTLGARDAFEGTRPIPDRPATLLRKLDVRRPRSVTPFPTSTYASRDLLVDVNAIVRHLAHVGLEQCIAVDLTRPDLDVPVVRVLVPGLAGPFRATSRRPTHRHLMRLV